MPVALLPQAAQAQAADAAGGTVPPAGMPATELSAAPVRAAARSYDHARELLAQNRPDEALQIIGQGLGQSPDDVRLLFQQGVVLARLNRVDEAVAAFTGLTQRFPELPEPYNNLAALYAQQGDLDRADAALHDALRALPGYSLAHENLGDLQLRLAERSYQRALDADAGNASARARLARVQELITQMQPAR